MSSRLAVLLSTLLLATGCQVTSDLGHQCVLVKKQLTVDANGKPVCRKDTSGNCLKDKNGNDIQDFTSVPILERELTAGQDTISFGAAECEDLICVRDAAAPPNPDYNPNGTDAQKNAPAQGYCSTPCVQGASASACKVTDSSVSTDLKNRMQCRSLLLDQASLDSLRASDPNGYKATFGDTNSPFFCAGGLATLPGQ